MSEQERVDRMVDEVLAEIGDHPLARTHSWSEESALCPRWLYLLIDWLYWELLWVPAEKRWEVNNA